MTSFRDICICNSASSEPCDACQRQYDRDVGFASVLEGAYEALTALPSFVGEALGEDPIGWESKVTAALASGDDAEAGRILRRTVQQYAQQCLCDAVEDRKCSPAEAVASLVAAHTPAIMGVAA